MSPVYYRLFKSGRRCCPSQLLLKKAVLVENKQTNQQKEGIQIKAKQKRKRRRRPLSVFAHLCLSLLRAVARLLTALWALFFADRPPAGEVAAVPRLRLVEPAEGPRFREPPPCWEAPNFERRVLPPPPCKLRRLLSFRPGERPPRERFDRLEALLERFRGLTRPVERRLTPP